MATASLLLVGPAFVPQTTQAATVTITVVNYEFQGGTVAVSQGTTVRWSFQAYHTATSDQLFWNSGFTSAGESYTRVFNDAGTFPYYCQVHGHEMMTGAIKVRLAASAISGGKRVQWSKTGGQEYDVRFKRVGATTWRTFRAGTTASAASFTPKRKGRFVFQARTLNTANGQRSDWSPSRRVRIL